MKTLIVCLSVLAGAVAFAATTQPNAIGLVAAVLDTKTLAQMNAATPRSTGQMVVVTDALISRVCVSSGTTIGAWVVAVATGSFTAASYPHCQ